MALIITPTETKKIYVQGTDIELQSTYVRLEFGCKPNGITMEIAFYTYANHDAFISNNYLPTTLPIGNIVKDINVAIQTQGLQAAHELSKTWFEECGYNVTVDLI